MKGLTFILFVIICLMTRTLSEPYGDTVQSAGRGSDNQESDLLGRLIAHSKNTDKSSTYDPNDAEHNGNLVGSDSRSAHSVLREGPESSPIINSEETEKQLYSNSYDSSVEGLKLNPPQQNEIVQSYPPFQNLPNTNFNAFNPIPSDTANDRRGQRKRFQANDFMYNEPYLPQSQINQGPYVQPQPQVYRDPLPAGPFNRHDGIYRKQGYPESAYIGPRNPYLPSDQSHYLPFNDQPPLPVYPDQVQALNPSNRYGQIKGMQNDISDPSNYPQNDYIYSPNSPAKPDSVYPPKFAVDNREVGHSKDDANKEEINLDGTNSKASSECDLNNCPRLENCLNVTETDCCPICSQYGCKCSGYQKFDCIANGFLDSTVPEGKSYLVDEERTMCNCPKGGGIILCSLVGVNDNEPIYPGYTTIKCSPIPVGCYEKRINYDGCEECLKLGCLGEGDRNYKAGERFTKDKCQECFCPEQGGRIYCITSPSCDNPSDFVQSYESRPQFIPNLTDQSQLIYSNFMNPGPQDNSGYDTRLWGEPVNHQASHSDSETQALPLNTIRNPTNFEDEEKNTDQNEAGVGSRGLFNQQPYPQFNYDSPYRYNPMYPYPDIIKSDKPIPEIPENPHYYSNLPFGSNTNGNFGNNNEVVSNPVGKGLTDFKDNINEGGMTNYETPQLSNQAETEEDQRLLSPEIAAQNNLQNANYESHDDNVIKVPSDVDAQDRNHRPIYNLPRYEYPMFNSYYNPNNPYNLNPEVAAGNGGNIPNTNNFVGGKVESFPMNPAPNPYPENNEEIGPYDRVYPPYHQLINPNRPKQDLVQPGDQNSEAADTNRPLVGSSANEESRENIYDKVGSPRRPQNMVPPFSDYNYNQYNPYNSYNYHNEADGSILNPSDNMNPAIKNQDSQTKEQESSVHQKEDRTVLSPYQDENTKITDDKTNYYSKSTNNLENEQQNEKINEKIFSSDHQISQNPIQTEESEDAQYLTSNKFGKIKQNFNDEKNANDDQNRESINLATGSTAEKNVFKTMSGNVVEPLIRTIPTYSDQQKEEMENKQENEVIFATEDNKANKFDSTTPKYEALSSNTVEMNHQNLNLVERLKSLKTATPEKNEELSLGNRDDATTDNPWLPVDEAVDVNQNKTTDVLSSSDNKKGILENSAETSFEILRLLNKTISEIGNEENLLREKNLESDYDDYAYHGYANDYSLHSMKFMQRLYSNHSLEKEQTDSFFNNTVDYADSYSPDKIHSQYDSIYDLDTTERENKAPLLQIEESYENVLSWCCTEGKQWGLNHDTCSGIPVEVVSYKQTCAMAQKKCCMKSLEERSCDLGVLSARNMTACDLIEPAFNAGECQSNTIKTCCDCCALGLKSYGMGLSCDMEILGHPCSGAYSKCCREGTKSTFSRETVDESRFFSRETTGNSSESSSTRGCDDSICQHHCLNLNDEEFQCTCRDGYQLQSDGFSCEDINECALGSHSCSIGEFCFNTEGSFTCQRRLSCGTGYVLKKDNTCDDIDECELKIDNCRGNLQCLNIRGSFRCVPRQCGPGFVTDATGSCIDINECFSGDYRCPPMATCKNTPGSWYCVCGRGFVMSEDSTECQDIDECHGDTPVCHADEECVNTVGSYKCTAIPTLACLPGYKPNDDTTACIDIDECEERRHRCLPEERCINVEGSYNCVQPVVCQNGTRPNSDETECIDIDECAEDLDHCGFGGRCINTIGSYRCSCMLGYQNTVVSDAYETCQDINECLTNEPSCQHLCQNTIGGYYCECPPGYTVKDGRYCEDIDECSRGSANCLRSETCFNTKGGYKCVNITCPENYAKLPKRRRTNVVKCVHSGNCQRNPQQCANMVKVYTYVKVHLSTIRQLYANSTLILRVKKSVEILSAHISAGNEEGYFELKPARSNFSLLLRRPIQGPWSTKLVINFKETSPRGRSVYKTVVVYVFVSKYEF